MIGVAREIREHRGTIARTLRETFGVGLSDLGGALSWGEARLLLEQAATDTSTCYGAELAGWAYPASMLDLIGIVGQHGKGALDARLMPWQMAEDAKQKPTVDEVAVASAEFEDEILFS
ncbi:hypothetical protein ACTJI8_12805 [Microbacterium sp. 22303]|uniref:hypothetical protein n=1 Tax=Microbacterium sp. 22303 TaxID=3453905 RepID=UPI003F833C72